jgi:hypothetical protein
MGRHFGILNTPFYLDESFSSHLFLVAKIVPSRGNFLGGSRSFFSTKSRAHKTMPTYDFRAFESSNRKPMTLGSVQWLLLAVAQMRDLDCGCCSDVTQYEGSQGLLLVFSSKNRRKPPPSRPRIRSESRRLDPWLPSNLWISKIEAASANTGRIDLERRKYGHSISAGF